MLDETTPTWWSTRHDSAWDATKDAVRTDWERTRSDRHVDDALDPDAIDTVKVNVADAEAEVAARQDAWRWERSERAVRYGFGARMTHAHEWVTIERDLAREWNVVDRQRPWEEACHDVKYGWDSAPKVNIHAQ